MFNAPFINKKHVVYGTTYKYKLNKYNIIVHSKKKVQFFTLFSKKTKNHTIYI
jgi:hypothetical protein